MRLLSYDLPYNIYVLLFGVYVSMRIACGSLRTRQRYLFSILCPILLLLQGVVLCIWNADTVRFLYPFIAHLPLILFLVFREKIRWHVALVSVSISYSICQIPRWIGLLLSLLHLMPAASILIHIALSHLLLVLMDRFFLTSIHSTICLSPHLTVSFGAMPILYYLYEYFMLYTNRRYGDLSLFNELMPTSLIIFFILFVLLYQREAQKRAQAEAHMQTLQMELAQADQQIKTLHAIEEQTSICRHDLRHHLAMIDGLLSCDRHEAALQYIREAQKTIDSIVPKRICENETANLLLCAYKEKAQKMGILLSIKAVLPQALPLSDTELCALLSNALENALNAVSRLPQNTDRLVDIFFCIRQDNLLLEIKNPYQGKVIIENGLPVSQDSGDHYGCRSIRSIVLRSQGICTFEAASGRFILRIVIPTKKRA